ncbi:SDR family oxidoreductase [Lacibacter sediminis]|uniref:SDR family NAD(P)-dependent oxidoreductase n=1 Tax=Lacibacter sediminis TaxID=2760713 RepID=A0A7G5XHG3_9BACT|nr:SDR family NAD(P)-dependent oxidoreductase [Lacibacter sediminis]QNA44916.1 SDR family NAD(P)-dependent oxidoreductase [Lacibacter sediminis]
MNVVITGASRGIGKAVAEIFAANGHALYLSSKSEVAIYKTMAELQDKYPGVKIKAKSRDLSKREEVDSFGKWVLDNSFNIDVLVNNAGNFLPGSVYNEEDGFLEEMIATNLYSAYHLTRKLLPQMMKQSPVSGSRGHIFNMCSIASLHAYKNGGAYSISKYAMHGFSKNLREEMKSHLIKVTSVFPGAVLTDSWGDYDNSSKRIMEADDIAKLVYASSQLSPQACVEDIIIRPQLGDL